MNDNHLTLFCLVDGEATSNAFPVEIESTKTIGDLKGLIKTKKTNDFQDVDADKLTLWRVSIHDDDDNDLPVLLDSVPVKKKLRATNKLSMVFDADLPEDTIHVIVQRPLPVAKRDREEDAGPSSSRKRHRPHTLKDAIEEAGLTEKAVVDDQVYLSRLSRKERVSLLASIGQDIAGDDIFSSLSRTALELHGANIKDMDKISAPRGILLPVVDTNDIYVREAYKDLYDTILGTFENNTPYTGNELKKHVIVTGTSGIGKSAFLVYFAIRLLAESDDDNPPIIVFHTKRSAKCYVFGGRSTVRSGNIETFKPFLSLPDTWYFVDSTPDPVLGRAKTVISASPKTLFSEAHQYQDVDKRVAWRYYMAPWSLEELKKCRISVVGFEVVPLEAVEELYSKIGGVPRYVLERPMQNLSLRPNDLERAKVMACERLEQALDRVKDPVMLMQYFSQGRDTLDFSSRLIHRWPMDDHETFRLEWASTYVAEKSGMLKKLVMDPNGSASGIMFEAYVLRTFREGGHIFELKDLETGQSARLEIPRNPEVTHFNTITPVTAGTLCIPKICNYACVDLLLAPRDLFQITVSKNHPIKGLPLSKLIDNLIQARWILPHDEPRLIFVVPGHVYADFEKQDYLTSEGKVYRTVPADIQRVRQYVLKIDLESAAGGKSPGLQIPAQQNAGTK
ncbi:hypothetical protein F5H01DRAFT_326786 [Linnemannia elongata]|nr:hypothetical protein F5H01DRAFT_327517 [Linnemannia elongata]KAK5796976.1 hypothetical protein F5H01DRAFT_327531 [Linnemannia elongata]KAK5799482.1 hypothetical protein F5H01DRAFT_326786 [Linnemannia elongata]